MNQKLILSLSILTLMVFQTAYPVARTTRTGTGSGLDCNGYSLDPHYRNIVNLSPYCAEPPRGFEDNGYYIGHDEPSVQFFSDAPNSASNMQWRINLPTADPTPTQDGTSVASFENYITFWFSLALCDPQSYPQGSCTPNSDTNTADSGSAILELQMYPPGWHLWAPDENGPSCSASQWCAALNIDSLECTSGFAFCNPNCMEPINFAFIQTDGIPAGPPGPDSQTGLTFTPNSKTLMMNPDDDLLITVKDTTNGLLNQINDLTTGTSGFMIAGAANGFSNTDVSTCSHSTFNFHPEYNTAAQGNVIAWSGLGANVNFAMEIGHFELGLTGDNDADDPPCFTSVPPYGISGCIDSAPGISGDTDFDGTSYVADWPDGSANHPHSVIIGAPSGNGVGPMSFDGTGYAGSYGTIQFATTQAGAVTFYPFYSQAGIGQACRFNFGNDIPGVTTDDFSGFAQYFSLPTANPCPPTSVGTVYSRVSVARGTDNGVYWNGFTGSWSGWQSLTGTTSNSTSLCQSGPGSIELVLRGTNNVVYHKSLSHGVWNASWDSPGGATSDQPSCAVLGGILYVLVRGMDNGLWYTSHKLGTTGWSGWSSLAGTTPSAPVLIASTATNRLDAIVRGSDGRIWHRTFSAGVWLPWESPGGTTSAVPAAASDGVILHLVVRGADNGVWYNTLNFTSSKWSGWTSLLGTTLLGPTVALDALGTVHVIVVGNDHGIWHKMKPAKGAWTTSWDSPGGSTTVRVSLAPSGSDLALLVQGGDRAVWLNRFASSAWRGWTSLGGLTPSTPSLSNVT